MANKICHLECAGLTVRMTIGRKDDKNSFYESPFFHPLTNKKDVKKQPQKIGSK